MRPFYNNVTDMASALMKRCVREGDRVSDMTMGNGNDTLLLSNLVGESGTVTAFDIQKEAVEATERLLEGRDNARLIHDGHENAGRYLDERQDFVIYNLGYLPGHEKKIKTETESTLKSLESVIPLLSDRGICVICCYLGHPGGREEYEAVVSYLEGLDKKMFNVLDIRWPNRRESAPRMIIIERTGNIR